jgi:hypothetical protein
MFLRTCVISNVYYKPAKLLDEIAMQEGNKIWVLDIDPGQNFPFIYFSDKYLQEK